MKAKSRRKLWSLLLVAIAAVGLTLYLTRHQPMARLRLGEKTELRAEYVTYGTQHRIPGAGWPMSKLTLLASKWDRLRISRRASDYQAVTSTPSLVAWISLYDLHAGRPMGYEGVPIGVSVVDEGCTFPSRVIGGSSSLPLPNAQFQFAVFDRRKPQLRLQIFSNGKVGESVIPNPAAKISYPRWEPEPAPPTRHIGELDFVLRGFSVRPRPSDASGLGSPVLTPQFETLYRGKKAEGLHLQEADFVMTDATGNRAPLGLPLPFSESAWKVSGIVTRTGDYPFAPDEGILLGPVPMPSGGHYSVFSLPDSTADQGGRLAALLGPGWYVWKQGAFLQARSTLSDDEAAAMAAQPEMADSLIINTATPLFVYLSDRKEDRFESGKSYSVVRMTSNGKGRALPQTTPGMLTFKSWMISVRQISAYELTSPDKPAPLTGELVHIQIARVKPEPVEFLIAPPQLEARPSPPVEAPPSAPAP